MKILYATSFGKDLTPIAHNPSIKKKLLELIEKLKAAESLKELHGVRKLIYI